jgi:hypothetical protein
LSILLEGLIRKKKWRLEGKQVIMCLDDRLGIEQDDELCKAVVNQVEWDLINGGFVPKVEKSLHDDKLSEYQMQT